MVDAGTDFACLERCIRGLNLVLVNQRDFPSRRKHSGAKLAGSKS